MSNERNPLQTESSGEAQNPSTPPTRTRRQVVNEPTASGMTEAGYSLLRSQGLSENDIKLLKSRGFGDDERRDALFREFTGVKADLKVGAGDGPGQQTQRRASSSGDEQEGQVREPNESLNGRDSTVASKTWEKEQKEQGEFAEKAS